MKSKLNQVLLLALCFGALLCCTFQVGLYGMPLPNPRFDWSLLAMVAFFDMAWIWIAKDNKVKHSLEGYVLLCLNLLAAGAIWLDNNPQLKALTFLAMPLALSLQSILLTKSAKEQFLKKDLAEKWIQDLFDGGWGQLPAYFRSRKQQKQVPDNAERKKTLLAVLAACLTVIPFAAIALVLLSSADSMFADFLEKIWKIEGIGAVIGSLLLGAVGAIAAISYFYYHSGLRQKETQSRQDAFWGLPKRKPLRVPAVFSAVFLLIMNVIYTAFSVIQFLHVFSGNTPENVTLSEYVVSGFWQLIFLTVMNILLLAAALYFTEPKNAWSQRIMSFLLVVNNTIMGVSAFVRLSNYEAAYGFTLIRLYGYFLLVLIGLLLILSAVKIFCHRFPLRNAMFWTVVVFAVSLLYFPTNGFVAQQNVNRYLQNPEKQIDTAYLEDLGEAAVPALEELKEKAPQDTVRQQAEQILSRFTESIAGGEGDSPACEEFTYRN